MRRLNSSLPFMGKVKTKSGVGRAPCSLSQSHTLTATPSVPPHKWEGGGQP